LERKRRQEEEEERQMRLKIQKRQERSQKEALNMMPTKPNKERSKRPSVKKKGEKSFLRMTQEELDYLKYVEGNQEVINMLMSPTAKPPRHM
jgi:uncharacterized membrane protein